MPDDHDDQDPTDAVAVPPPPISVAPSATGAVVDDEDVEGETDPTGDGG